MHVISYVILGTLLVTSTVSQIPNYCGLKWQALQPYSLKFDFTLLQISDITVSKNSAEDCKSRCVGNNPVNCRAISYVPSNGTCYYSVEGNFNIIHIGTTRPIYVQYVLVNRCGTRETPWNEDNCYGDDPKNPDLPDLHRITLPGQLLTPEFCAEKFCKQEGWRYAGSQGLSICYCGNTYGRHGWSSRCCKQLNSTDCVANPTHYANKIITIPLPFKQSSIFQLESCLNDNSQSRDLPKNGYLGDKANTLEKCQARCLFLSYMWAGAQGDDCWCGNSPGVHGWNKAACTTPCSGGDGYDNCGGPNAYSRLATGVEWYSEGCYADHDFSRDLPVRAIWNVSTMTRSLCQTTCRTLNYPIAATQDGRHCFCGSVIGRYGWAKGKCTTPCSGEPRLTCGGHNANQRIIAFVPQEHGHCYYDNAEQRDLPAIFQENDQGMTQFACIRGCYDMGYMYAGVQGGKSCYCGNSFGLYGISQSCTITCLGDSSLQCGGTLSSYIMSTHKELHGIKCFKDFYVTDELERDLPYAVANDGAMTRTRCVTACQKAGFLYAGLQDGSACFCGNMYGRYGWWTDCNKPCTGDPTQTCGGGGANYIIPADNHEHLPRCMKDMPGVRDLPYKATIPGGGQNLTPWKCVDACLAKGFAYAGVMNGLDCNCGNTYGRYGGYRRFDDNTPCNKTCPGDSTKTCGGAMYNWVMQTSIHNPFHMNPCNRDDPQDPDMLVRAGDEIDLDLTREKCILSCAKMGYSVAAVQNGVMCSCGQTYGRYGWVSSGCDAPCSGDPSQTCGGKHLNYVMAVEGLVFRQSVSSVYYAPDD